MDVRIARKMIGINFKILCNLAMNNNETLIVYSECNLLCKTDRGNHVKRSACFLHWPHSMVGHEFDFHYSPVL